MATVDVAYIEALLHFAEGRGLTRASLLEAVQIGPQLLSEEHARVPSDKLYTLFDHLAERTGDPCVGLSVAAETEPDSGALAMVSYAATNAANIGEVAERAAQLMSIVDDTNHFFLEKTSEHSAMGCAAPTRRTG